MQVFENIKMALISILDNKLRSFLTMISIIIGIASVIAITSIGRGVSNNLVDSVLEMTKGQMNITYKPKSAIDDGNNNGMAFSVSEEERDKIYNEQQIMALKELPGVTDVLVANSDSTEISYLEHKVENQTFSTIKDEETFSIYNASKIVRGRMFSQSEFNNRDTVMLVHEKNVAKLFPNNENPIGKELIVNGKIFTVIGTYEEKELPIGMGVYVDYASYIPLNSWETYKGYSEIQSLSIVPNTGADLKQLGLSVVSTLTSHAELEGTYEIFNIDTILKQVEDQLSMMTMFITMIAAISLIVGGIGVMNIMYVSVVERTHEIGLRKALGAGGGQVLGQFLVESITITSLGGLIGIVLGLLGNLLGATLIDYQFQIYTDVVLVGFGFAAAIGLVFGTLPAQKAAKMQPIDALRSL